MARYLAGSSRVRSYTEQKQLKAQRAQRRAERSERRRRRRGGEEEDDEFEGGRGRRDRRASAPPGEARHEPPPQVAEQDLVGLEVALVLGVDAGRCRVRRTNGRESPADLDAALARTQRSSVAVGDRAVVDELADGRVRVRAIVERRSVLARPDPGTPSIERVVAANVDRAIVVAAARAPALRPRLIDRYLVALERGGIEPVVCVSKTDLVADDAGRAEVDGVLAEYRDIGITALAVSVESGAGVADLRRAVDGCTSVLVGQSGVGKSSLANALFGAALGGELETGRVRHGDGKGRHTTTRSDLFVVDERGTRVIDTPGVRSFGLAHVTRSTLAEFFRDFDGVREHCRFSDCSHTDEPGCAVRDAVECGDVAERRYRAYLRIRASLDER